MTTPLPAEGQVETCAGCGRVIMWEFDNEEDPYGLWYGAESGTEVCTPGPNDEDRYHGPEFP